MHQQTCEEEAQQIICSGSDVNNWVNDFINYQEFLNLFGKKYYWFN